MAITPDLSGNGTRVAETSYMKPTTLNGNGTPEGRIAAPVGTQYQRLDGGANTSWYVKESGTGNTGWIGK